MYSKRAILVFGSLGADGGKRFLWLQGQAVAHVTLKQLRYFDALARVQHFGKAADLCSVTQPALSMQIRELEQNLGLDLVERTR